MNIPSRPKNQKQYSPTFAEIDLKAVCHNLLEIRRFAYPHTKILAVVKADAYGHGMREVAGVLEKEGVDFFGVSNIDEGVILREEGIRKPILLFEHILPSYAKEIVDYNLTASLGSLDLAKTLHRCALRKNKKVNVHVKIDTGMGRLGIWHTEALALIKSIQRLSALSIEGVYTHFPVADTDRSFTRQQAGLLYRLVTQLDKYGIVIPYAHAANSMGLVGYKIETLNLARPGLMLYGMYPAGKLKSKIKLKPALSVKSKIIFLKKVAQGRSISYGRTFVAKKNMMIATLPVGYNDGYFRVFSNNASVLVKGVRCPVVGRVTMDQTMVDVTKAPSVKVGSDVVLLGRQGNEEISADELAEKASTINYEITCSLGNRLTRSYIK